VAAAALEEGIVNPFTRIFCGGSIHYGNRDFRCWKKGGHGWMNLHEALVQSCDVFFYQVGQRLGVDTIAEYARRFGLGLPTGIQLDHEKSGTIPDSEWKRRTRGEPWYSGETLSVAVGQGYVTTTPLQMASLIATVAAAGTRRRPYFVEGVELPTGETAEAPEKSAFKTGIRSSTMTQIQAALRDVVQTDAGTGKRARIPGLEIAGKTGTSQAVRMGQQAKKVDQMKVPRELRDHAWFLSFAPFAAPEIAVACLIEHGGGGGGLMAAPVVRQLLEHYFGVKKPPVGADDRQTAFAPH
jgi:penicillin-binding protein 2